MVDSNLGSVVRFLVGHGQRSHDGGGRDLIRGR